MENHEPLFNEVKDIVSGIWALIDRAYQQYSSLVDAVIKDEITANCKCKLRKIFWR